MVVRAHREKVGDLWVGEGEGVGRWLGVVSRAVMGAVREGEGEEEEGGKQGGDGENEERERDVGDWNVVQNNGLFGSLSFCHLWDGRSGATDWKVANG